MQRWYEIRLTITPNARTRDWTKENYELIRSSLLPIIKKLSIEDFLILNYYEMNVRDFIRFRVRVDLETLKEIRASLRWLKRNNLIHRFRTKKWNPTRDARARINSVRRQLNIPVRGWKITDRDGRWFYAPDDYRKKVSDFATMMEKVVGRCARVFIEEIGIKTECRWLMSLFVHLLFNSICCTIDEENKIRAIPAI